MRSAIFVCAKTGLSSIGTRRMYSFPSESHQEDLDSKKPSLSDEPELPDLIKEEMSGSMSFHYGNVRSKDERLRGGS